VGYLLLAGIYYILRSLPILPLDRAEATADILRPLHPPHKEFGETFRASPILPGKRGWEELVQEVAEVFDELPPEDRAEAGIYADWYLSAGAIDELGPKYGLPHAVSGGLTYYLCGPGYYWDVMILVSHSEYPIRGFFKECELKKVIDHPYAYVGSQGVRVCRNPKFSADEIWSKLKLYR